MTIRGMISIALLMSGLSTSALASSIAIKSDLNQNPSRNLNLGSGDYDFAGVHSRYNSKFNDTWKFTVATDTTVSISIYDLDKPATKSNASKLFNVRPSQQRFNKFNASKVFDTKNLALSVFDSKHRLLGQAGENETLNNLSLLAGKWYTIQVTGRVNSFVGSAYRGVLDMNPTPVPLGDTAPMLGSALALLALRCRKRFSNIV